MKEDYIMLLNRQGYTVIDENDFFILSRKLVKNRAKLIVFLPISLAFLFLSLGNIHRMDFLSVFGLLSVGVIIFCIPFWEYLTSPFFSFYVDKKLRTILFRAKHSRAYKFSEITKMSLGVASRYTETNAFSDSNKEYDYRMDVYFGRSKEELFKIVERDEKSEEQIIELKEFFENLLE